MTNYLPPPIPTFLLTLTLGGLLSSCSLINSLNVSTRYTTPIENFHGHDYETKNIPGSLSLTVKGVDHPSFYGQWDHSFKFKPSVHYERLKLESDDERTNPQTGKREKVPSIRLKRGSAFANGELTGHTPIGAFSFIVGYGTTIYRATNGQEIDILQTSDIFKYELSYVAFFAKRWYFNFAARIFQTEYTTASAAIKIGYYFSEVAELIFPDKSASAEKSATKKNDTVNENLIPSDDKRP